MAEISYGESVESGRRKIGKRLLFFAFFGLIILALAGSVIYFVMRDRSPEPTKTITLDEPQETTQETPTPTVADIERSEIKLAVQNGSGRAGAAASAAATLREAGYQIVSTGNADNFDYEDIVIMVKESKKDLLEVLKSDLEKEYTVGSSSADLEESAAYDGLVIVGQ
jgi:hypothetical protein